jgi:hypothetical protein
MCKRQGEDDRVRFRMRRRESLRGWLILKMHDVSDDREDADEDRDNQRSGKETKSVQLTASRPNGLYGSSEDEEFDAMRRGTEGGTNFEPTYGSHAVIDARPDIIET